MEFMVFWGSFTEMKGQSLEKVSLALFQIIVFTILMQISVRCLKIWEILWWIYRSRVFENL